MADKQVTIQIHDSLSQIEAGDWDICARAGDPFITHRFLKALEDSGSVGPRTGWQPQYITAWLGDQMIACAPLYAKSQSQGEYIFDHHWADAYQRAGGRYYPKLQIAVPFTPVTGHRLLIRPGFEDVGQAALIQGAIQLADQNRLSSLHITFCTGTEAEAGKQMGLMPRVSQQFHWLNDGYADFDEFLASLSSRKRKNIRKERRIARGFGGDILMLTGDQIKPEHWDAFWIFYQDTGARKWGTPYLTRGFFDNLHETMRDDVLLIMAMREGRAVAGALNMIGTSALYGRYWGCIEDHPCLHFELCYYRAIEFAISHGLKRVEAGAQGEHKLARGYLPVSTHSLHWVGDAGFADAIAQYLKAERVAVVEDIEVLTSYGPFRKVNSEDHE